MLSKNENSKIKRVSVHKSEHRGRHRQARDDVWVSQQKRAVLATSRLAHRVL